MPEITIVGAGLSGLIAAIELAEKGARVVLHEAGSQPGGRARTDASAHRVNLGPHALYRRGAFGEWLTEKGLRPSVHFPSLTGMRFRQNGRVRRRVAGLLRLPRSARKPAPMEESYRDWATREFGPDFSKLAIGFASLPTYHPDPGVLSAAFVQERIARSVQWRPVWYIRGGWIKLIDKLVVRAEELGAEIVTHSKLLQLPDGPCIVATELSAAAKLLGEPGLAWPSPNHALLDVSIRRRSLDPTAILDLDEHAYVSNFSAGDASAAPRGESLLQGVTAIRDGETAERARERILGALDAGFKNWRDRVAWKRTGVTLSNVGACDPPGTTWRDRPAIDRGNSRWLVGDHVAAPGILSETCFESARIAARLAWAKLQ